MHLISGKQLIQHSSSSRYCVCFSLDAKDYEKMKPHFLALVPPITTVFKPGHLLPGKMHKMCITCQERIKQEVHGRSGKLLL